MAAIISAPDLDNAQIEYTVADTSSTRQAAIAAVVIVAGLTSIAFIVFAGMSIISTLTR
jgi:hypothetical protein